VVIYLDTSAFLKLYVRESGSEVVQEIVRAQFDPLPIWDVLRAEVTNALWLNVFWGHIESDEVNRLHTLFNDRLRRGQYFVVDVDRDTMMTTFTRLAQHTPKSGCRTMDILHVACALQLDPDQFVSFDSRQRSLATTAGLSVVPAE
jgi:hypothetical protein